MSTSLEPSGVAPHRRRSRPVQAPSIESDVKPTPPLCARWVGIERPGSHDLDRSLRQAWACDRFRARFSSGYEGLLLRLPSLPGNQPSIRASGAIPSFGSARGHSQVVGPPAGAGDQPLSRMLPLDPSCPGADRAPDRELPARRWRRRPVCGGRARSISSGRTPLRTSTSPRSSPRSCGRP